MIGKWRCVGQLPMHLRPKKERRRMSCGALTKTRVLDEFYFDTDFLNMRSIFSLIASMAVEFD